MKTAAEGGEPNKTPKPRAFGTDIYRYLQHLESFAMKLFKIRIAVSHISSCPGSCNGDFKSKSMPFSLLFPRCRHAQGRLICLVNHETTVMNRNIESQRIASPTTGKAE
jgi:hypothetical protein